MNNSQDDENQLSAVDDVGTVDSTIPEEVGQDMSGKESNIQINDSNQSASGDMSTDTAANPLLPSDDSHPAGLIKDDGEINWDCPCLQGMADGPCGEEFKAAFSCFHYSEAEPKGVDCLKPFKDMQECFLKHPDVYGSLDDDLEDEQEEDKPLENEDGNKNNNNEENTIVNERVNETKSIEPNEELRTSS